MDLTMIILIVDSIPPSSLGFPHLFVNQNGFILNLLM
jgi:hypothetical protein